MRRSGHGRSTQKFPAKALVLLSLAAVAIGLSVVGDASAIDLLNHPRKAKTVAPGTAPTLSKGPALSKSNQLGINQSRPTPSWNRSAALSQAGQRRALPGSFRQFQAQHQ